MTQLDVAVTTLRVPLRYDQIVGAISKTYWGSVPSRLFIARTANSWIMMFRAQQTEGSQTTSEPFAAASGGHKNRPHMPLDPPSAFR